MKILATFIPTETEVIAMHKIAAARGHVILTRMHPVTRKQQTVCAPYQLAGWQQMRIAEKRA